MRVFGIDCGTEITGFGVVEVQETIRESRLVSKSMGAIRLLKTAALPVRLDQVFRELSAEMKRWQPDTVAVEEVFYSVNAKSALKLGQVRGVALLAAARLGIPIAEYAPLTIKSSVVGYGLAKKEQVQFMVARLLDLAELPQPADVADALAIAICHIRTAETLALQALAPQPVARPIMRRGLEPGAPRRPQIARPEPTARQRPGLAALRRSEIAQ